MHNNSNLKARREGLPSVWRNHKEHFISRTQLTLCLHLPWQRIKLASVKRKFTVTITNYCRINPWKQGSWNTLNWWVSLTSICLLKPLKPCKWKKWMKSVLSNQKFWHLPLELIKFPLVIALKNQGKTQLQILVSSGSRKLKIRLISLSNCTLSQGTSKMTSMRISSLRKFKIWCIR